MSHCLCSTLLPCKRNVSNYYPTYGPKLVSLPCDISQIKNPVTLSGIVFFFSFLFFYYIYCLFNMYCYKIKSIQTCKILLTELQNHIENKTTKSQLMINIFWRLSTYILWPFFFGSSSILYLICGRFLYMMPFSVVPLTDILSLLSV